MRFFPSDTGLADGRGVGFDWKSEGGRGGQRRWPGWGGGTGAGSMCGGWGLNIFLGGRNAHQAGKRPF